MTFAHDRDLIATEPNLLRDLPMLSQQRLYVNDAAVSGVTLTSNAADFLAAQLDTGSVVLLDGVPLEVMEAVDAGTLVVSMLRSQSESLAIPPGDRIDGGLVVRTFGPQIERVHRALLERLGISTPTEQRETTWTVDMISSTDRMVELETLGTLAHVYTMAQAMTGDGRALRERAAHYQQAYDRLRERTSIRIDPGGDGRADITVPLGRVRLARV